MRRIAPIVLALAMSCSGGEPYRKTLVSEYDRMARTADGAFRAEGLAARSVYERVLAQYRGLDDQQGIARTINNIGVLDYYEGKLIDAAARFEEAAAMYDRDGAAPDAAEVRLNLASVRTRQGRSDDAKRVRDQAQSILRAQEDPVRRALAGGDASEDVLAKEQPSLLAARASQAGWERLDAGDVDGAERHFLRALELDRKAEDLLHLAEDLNMLGYVSERRGRFEEAADLYGRAKVVNAQLGLTARAARDEEDLQRVRKARPR